MSGEIFQILVRAGDAIAEDDEVIILEVFNMKYPIYASAGGIVKEVIVIEGQQVAEGDVLVVLG